MGYRHKKVSSIIVMVSTILWLVGLSTLSVFAQGAGREWEILNQAVSYTHLTLPTTPYV